MHLSCYYHVGCKILHKEMQVALTKIEDMMAIFVFLGSGEQRPPVCCSLWSVACQEGCYGYWEGI